MANCDTGHLISAELFADLKRENLDAGYREVPERLQGEAAQRLSGKVDALVAKDEKGPLADWMHVIRSKEEGLELLKKSGMVTIGER